jgi:hypothetical protein
MPSRRSLRGREIRALAAAPAVYSVAAKEGRCRRTQQRGPSRTRDAVLVNSAHPRGADHEDANPPHRARVDHAFPGLDLRRPRRDRSAGDPRPVWASGPPRRRASPRGFRRRLGRTQPGGPPLPRRQRVVPDLARLSLHGSTDRTDPRRHPPARRIRSRPRGGLVVERLRRSRSSPRGGRRGPRHHDLQRRRHRRRLVRERGDGLGPVHRALGRLLLEPARIPVSA